MNNELKLNLEIEVAVIKSNIKDMRKNNEVDKHIVNEKLDLIKKDIDTIALSLQEHVKWEELYHKDENKKVSSLYDRMGEYIDIRHQEAINEINKLDDRCAKSWTEKAVYGLFGFIGIILISTIGYLWPAKMNDDSQNYIQTEQEE